MIEVLLSIFLKKQFFKLYFFIFKLELLKYENIRSKFDNNFKFFLKYIFLLVYKIYTSQHKFHNYFKILFIYYFN